MPNLTAELLVKGHCLRLNRPTKSKGAKRVWVKRITPKLSALKARYNRLLPGWMARHPVCEVCPIINANGFRVRCLGATKHPHHIKGRRGELLCDEKFMIACCGGESHPPWIHQTNKQDAINLGLLIQ